MSPDQSPSPPTVPIFSKNKSKQQFINGNRLKECGYLHFNTEYDRIEPVKKNIPQGSVSDPDPHKDLPPGSGSPWTDAYPDPGGKKA